MVVMRSALFVPGTNVRAINKCTTLKADIVVLDLEDSIPMSEKETARVLIADFIPLLRDGKPWPKGEGRKNDVWVRTNGVNTGLLEGDMPYVVHEKVNGLMIPKVEHAEEVVRFAKLMDEVGKKKGVDTKKIGLMPTVETALGALNSYEMCKADPRVVAIGFGAVDFTKDMGVTLTNEGKELYMGRAFTSMSARAAGVMAMDTVFIDLADREGLKQSSYDAKQMGFKGKYLIHPNQIETVNEMFTPSKADIEWAEKVVEVFEKDALSKGLAAISVGNKMVDIPVYEQNKELLERAKEIEAKEKA